MTVAGQKVTVTQGQGCTFSINPTQESIPSAGGNGKVAVTAGAGCGWTAASDVPWITVQSGASGSGDGAVTYTVAPTTGPGRTGTLTVAGQKVTVTQGQGCTFSINPTQQSVPAGGDGGKVAVTAADGCGWTASSSATWISIVSGATGTGAGDVQYMVAATTGPARAGTLTIAGQTFTVNQGQGCTFSIAPTSATVPDTGGQTSFDVQSATGCAWTASSQALWISIASGSSGSGNGTVQLTVAANTGPARTGTVTTAGTTFTVTQGAGCSYSLSPSSADLPAGGGNRTVNVSAPAGCTWNASSSAPWLTIANPPSGTGDGSVSFTAAANTSSSRSATLTIAGQTFMVNQATGCTYTVAPETVASPASGGPERIDITSATGCAWTATSNVPWIGIPGSASGSGNGTVDLSIAANTGPSRSGTATVAGRTVTVNQATGCTFSIAPPSARVVAAGGTTSVNVTAGAGCGWMAATSSTWIVVSNGAPGTGNGTVQLTVQANTTGATRSDTVLIAGHTFTVDQDK